MKSRHGPGKTGSAGNPQKAVKQTGTNRPPDKATAPFAGKPLDGSQYHDVIEEQEYADRRPSPEEQTPRYSYLHQQEQRRGK